MHFMALYVLLNALVYSPNQVDAAAVDATSAPGVQKKPCSDELVQLQAIHRDKRCSCENLKDKECVYFCHIGIVWLNTPSQTAPYGMGSPRLRRNTKRCHCIKGSDLECDKFCTSRKPLLNRDT